MRADLHLINITPEQAGRVAAVMAERRDRLSWADREELFRAGWAWDMADGWTGPAGERVTEADPEQRDRLRCAATGTLLRHAPTSRNGEQPRCSRCGVAMAIATLPCPGRLEAEGDGGKEPQTPDGVPGGLPKPDRVETGQWFAWDSGVGGEPFRVRDVSFDGTTHGRTADGVSRVCSARLILQDPSCCYLGNGDRPVEPPAPHDAAKRAGEEGPVAPAAEPAPSEPTARDAVAGMLLRLGYEDEAKDIADQAPELRIAANIERRRPAGGRRSTCIAALEALDRGDLRVVRGHQDLFTAVDRLTRERDEARAQVARLQAELLKMSSEVHDARFPRVDATLRPAEDVAREMVSGAVERMDGDWGFTIWIDGTDGRGVDLSVDGYAREESAKRDSDSARKTIAGLIERSRAEGMRAAGHVPPAQDEQQATGGVSPEPTPRPLLSVGTVYFASREGTAEERASLVASLTQHLQAKINGQGGERGDIDLLSNVDGSVRLEIPRAADPRAVLATVAELLGLPDDELVADDRIAAHEAGIREGERRAKAKAEELVTQWEADRKVTLRLRDAAEPTSVTWGRRDSSAAIRRSCILTLCDTFEIEAPPPDGQPPTGGEPAPEEVVARSATTDHVEPVPSAERPRLAAGQRWRDRGGFEITMRRREDTSAGFDLDGVFASGSFVQFRTGERAPYGWTLVSDATADDERWQPGAVWEHRAKPLIGATRRTVACMMYPVGGALVGFRGSSEAVPCAEMTEANGWRYVGRPASEVPATGLPVGVRKVTWSGSAAAEVREAGERSPARATIEVQAEEPAAPTTQAVTHGGVTVTAPEAMSLGEVWAALSMSPAFRVCLDAELRQARESARGTTPADIETARRDIRAAVLDDAFRAGVEEGQRRAHADGIVEGLRRAREIARQMGDRDRLQAVDVHEMFERLDAAVREAEGVPAPVDRAALLALAEGWETEATELKKSLTFEAWSRSGALDYAAADLRRLLDAPRGPGGGERGPDSTSPPAPQDGSRVDHGEATRGHQLTPRPVDAAATPAVWVCRNPICRAPETSSVSAPCGCGAWLERVDHAAADPGPPVKSVHPTGGMGDGVAELGAPAVNAAPDRERLGRMSYDIWCDVACSLFAVAPEPGGWDALPERNREMNRIVGERLFNLGVQHAERSAAGPGQGDLLERIRAALGACRDELTLHAAQRAGRALRELEARATRLAELAPPPRCVVPVVPRLVPVSPGPLAELADRIAGYLVDAFAEPSDGELRGRAIAVRVLQMVDAYLHPTPPPPSGPSTPDAPAQDGSRAIHLAPLSDAERAALRAADYAEGADGTWCHLWAGEPADPRTPEGLRRLRDAAAAAPNGGSPGAATAAAPEEHEPEAPAVNAAPDREQLGQEVHEVACARAQETGLAGARWDDLRARDRETACRIGERLCGMGVAAGSAEAEGLRKTVERLKDELQKQHDAHRDAIWQVKAILGAPPTDSLRATAEKTRAAIQQATNDLRASNEALRKAAEEQERLRSEIDSLKADANSRSLSLRGILGAVHGESTEDAARRVMRAASFDRQNRDAASAEAEALRKRVADPEAARAEGTRLIEATGAMCRANGAAEMRERASDAVVELARSGALTLVEAEQVVQAIRALPLSIAPAACAATLDTNPSVRCEGGHAPGDSHRSDGLRWGEGAAAYPCQPVDRVARAEAQTLHETPDAKRGAPPSAPELDVLRRAGWRTDGELWRDPGSNLIDPRTPFGAEAMRRAVERQRAEAVPADAPVALDAGGGP